MDGGVEGGGDEARVVWQPRDRPDGATMCLEGVIDWVLSRVEVVDMDEVNEHACEEMTTI